MSKQILKIDSLSKKFGKLMAVDGISLEVNQGEIYGILGPNGSGKTTTLGMILGVLNPSSGNFSWFENGQKDENRLNIGTLLETPNFYPYLNAYDNLKIVAKIKKVKNEKQRIDEVLEIVDLTQKASLKFKTFSLGMKQRLAIASALISDPDVLVLDEPTNGLDPIGIADIRRIIQNLAYEGKTIILASHILDEMEKICTKVSVMRNGKLLKTATLNELIGTKESIHIKSDSTDKIKTILYGKMNLLKEENNYLIFDGENSNSSEVNETLANNGIYVDQIFTQKQSLETAFLKLLTEKNQ